LLLKRIFFIRTTYFKSYFPKKRRDPKRKRKNKRKEKVFCKVWSYGNWWLQCSQWMGGCVVVKHEVGLLTWHILSVLRRNGPPPWHLTLVLTLQSSTILENIITLSSMPCNFVINRAPLWTLIIVQFVKPYLSYIYI
jgi:hypothetical protein